MCPDKTYFMNQAIFYKPTVSGRPVETTGYRVTSVVSKRQPSLKTHVKTHVKTLSYSTIKILIQPTQPEEKHVFRFITM